jgi:hypothetical protein
VAVETGLLEVVPDLPPAFPDVADLPTYRRSMGDVPGECGLPPEKYWLVDPAEKQIPTPVDARGLILVPELIQTVKNTVDPEYKWPPHLSVHHLYWEGWWYESAFAGDSARKFRELPIHKALVPRMFENWLHCITEPPDVPDPEVMEYRVEAWSVAESLFRSVRQAVNWERKARRRAALLERKPETLPEEFNGEDIIGREVIGASLQQHFAGMDRELARLERIPPEFRLVEPDESHITLAAQLGKIVGPRAMQLTRFAAA